MRVQVTRSSPLVALTTTVPGRTACAIAAHRGARAVRRHRPHDHRRRRDGGRGLVRRPHVVRQPQPGQVLGVLACLAHARGKCRVARTQLHLMADPRQMHRQRRAPRTRAHDRRDHRPCPRRRSTPEPEAPHVGAMSERHERRRGARAGDDGRRPAEPGRQRRQRHHRPDRSHRDDARHRRSAARTPPPTPASRQARAARRRPRSSPCPCHRESRATADRRARRWRPDRRRRRPTTAGSTASASHTAQAALGGVEREHGHRRRRRRDAQDVGGADIAGADACADRCRDAASAGMETVSNRAGTPR